MKKEEFYLTTGKRDFENLFYPKKGIRVDPVEGTTVLIEGSAGVGKTTLAIEMVKNAILSKDAKCLYYLFDQTSNEIKLLMQNFGWNKDITYSTHDWNDILIDKVDNIKFNNHFNIIEMQSLDTIESTIPTIREHVKKITNSSNNIVVIDSIGANSELAKLDRKSFSSFLKYFKGYNTIVFLIREKDIDVSMVQNEYLTNAVMDLQVQKNDFIDGIRVGSFTTTIEIKKTRNQPSIRGPHEFVIKSPPINTSSESIYTGFIVYPSLQSVAKINELSRTGEKEGGEDKDRALFDIPKLDNAIGESGEKGIPYGQTILLKGPPGNHKTDLSLRFLFGKLINDIPNENERTLFVSCRLDKAALKTNELFKKNGDLKRIFFRNMVFIDARESYKTPEMIMSLIREKVDENKNKPIRRAVIFGISMLETLPTFEGSALHFLQVLLSYFKTVNISCIWVDWMLSQDSSNEKNKPLLQTEFASHLVAAELTVESIPQVKNETEILPAFSSFKAEVKLLPSSENKPDNSTSVNFVSVEGELKTIATNRPTSTTHTLLKLTRKNYRSSRMDVGILTRAVDKNGITKLEIV